MCRTKLGFPEWLTKCHAADHLCIATKANSDSRQSTALENSGYDNRKCNSNEYLLHASGRFALLDLVHSPYATQCNIYAQPHRHHIKFWIISDAVTLSASSCDCHCASLVQYSSSHAALDLIVASTVAATGSRIATLRAAKQVLRRTKRFIHSVLQGMLNSNLQTALFLQQNFTIQECSACPLPAQRNAHPCSVLQRMLRRNPLAALSLQQPSLRTPSLQLADDMPFELDKEGDAESPDGTYLPPECSL